MTQAAAPPDLDRPSVDPRFRRRWAEARRAEGRRRLRVLVALVVVAAVVAGSFGLLHSSVFKVRDVVIRGNAHTPRAQVLRAAGLLQPARPTLMVDAGSASARRAVQALPWVSRAVFARHWPWTIVITLRERVPAALVEARGTTEVVDSTGRALYVAGARAPKGLLLPTLTGAGPAPPGRPVSPSAGMTRQQLADVLAAASALPRPLARRGVQLAYSRQLGLVAYVGGQRVLVLLGGPDAMATKWAVLEDLAARVGLAGYSEVDLSVPERPALTPRGTPANG